MAAPTAPLRTLREGPCNTSEVCPAQEGAGTGARFRPQTPMQVGWEPFPGAPGIRFGVGATVQYGSPGLDHVDPDTFRQTLEGKVPDGP